MSRTTMILIANNTHWLTTIAVATLAGLLAWSCCGETKVTIWAVGFATLTTEVFKTYLRGDCSYMRR